MNNQKEFWYFMLQGTLDATTGGFANFYVHGDHCGAALEQAAKIAISEGLDNPQLIETTRLDILENFELPNEAVQIDSESYMLQSISAYELNDEEYSFVPPTGIAFDTEESELDPDLIQQNFVAYNQNDNGVFEFELVVDNTRLSEVFYKTLDFLPSIDAFWLYISHEWDGLEDELWASKKITTKEALIDFLNSTGETTIKNGFVTLVAHTPLGETNLTLSDHKKIQLHTKDEKIFSNFIGHVVDLGFEQTKEFYNIEFGYHHWHYRTANSLNRNKFTELLNNEKFELINTEENGL